MVGVPEVMCMFTYSHRFCVKTYLIRFSLLMEDILVIKDSFRIALGRIVDYQYF